MANETYKAGQFVNAPTLIVSKKKGCYCCPICKKEWHKTGRGIGFVKSGAKSHVFSCFKNLLKNQNLRLGKYDMEKLAYPLIELN